MNIGRINSGITGVGKFFPEKVVTNADLEKIVDTNDEWIRTRTGIKERHFVEPGTGASDLALPACSQGQGQPASSNLQTLGLHSRRTDAFWPILFCVRT